MQVELKNRLRSLRVSCSLNCHETHPSKGIPSLAWEYHYVYGLAGTEVNRMIASTIYL